MFNLLALLLRVIRSFIDPRTVVKLITMVEILRLSIRLCDNAWVIWLGASRARQPITANRMQLPRKMTRSTLQFSDEFISILLFTALSGLRYSTRLDTTSATASATA